MESFVRETERLDGDGGVEAMAQTLPEPPTQQDVYARPAVTDPVGKTRIIQQGAIVQQRADEEPDNVLSWVLASSIFVSTESLLQGVLLDEKQIGTIRENIAREFFWAYGVDGFDSATKLVTCADGTTAEMSQIPFGWRLISFLGLPSRPASADDLSFSPWQLWRNFIGGWNPVEETITGASLNEDGAPKEKPPVEGAADDTIQFEEDSFTQKRWTEKKIFLGFVLSFKILVIAPFKLITFPFKLMLNVVKLATEFLLPLVSFYTAYINAYMVLYLIKLVAPIVSNNEPACDSCDDEPRDKAGLGILWIVPLLPLTLAVGIFQYATLLACRIGLALTSPQKSYQLAFKAGYSFPVENKVVKTIMGLLGAALSLALSAVLWAITLPLALGALIATFPVILTAINTAAQWPLVASTLAWLLNLPLVAASTTLLQSVFGTVGVALTATFGPAVTALAGLISVQVPALVLLVGITLGLIVTPLAAGLSHAADKLSDLWARWVEQAPIAALKALFRSKPAKVDALENAVELTSVAPKGEKISSDKPSAESQAYLYHPHEGILLISETPLYLVYELKKSEAEADDFLPGIKLTGEKAEALFDRAKNVEEKGLLTQGVCSVSTLKTTGEGTKANPYVLGR